MAKTTAKKKTRVSTKIIEPEKNDSLLSSLTKRIDGNLKYFVGLSLLFSSVFLTISFISYCFTWKHDQSALFANQSFFDYLFHNGIPVINSAGRLGAWVSHQFMYNGFGLSSFLILPLLFIWGLNYLRTKRIYSTLRLFAFTTLYIILLTPILSYFFSAENYHFPFGGALGNRIIHELNQLAGNIGTLCLILGLLLILLYPLLRFLGTHIKLPPRREIAVVKEEPKPEVILSAPEPEEIFDPVPAPPFPSDITDEPLIIKDLNPFNSSPMIELENEMVPVPPPPPSSSSSSSTEMKLEVLPPASDQPKHIPISIGTDEPYDPSLELRKYKFPTLDLLETRGKEEIAIDKNELEHNKNQIINTLKSFGISIAKISATVGPTVTLYEIVPAEGVRISKIRNLEDDIALSLSALGIRIIAPIPGKGTIGIEVPNIRKQIVSMRTLISSDKFIHNSYSLPIALGKKIDNENYIVDLATMPHLLMAGATGQGKSVGINAILVSLLYKKHPSQLKFVMVDPKKVELSVYKYIEKHFLAKLPNEEEAIITDTKKVINTLNALCIEMDNRYNQLKDAGVRNIKEYNEKFIKRKLLPSRGHQYLPFIVLVVDEFADLIMTAGKEVEMPIARLAQLARAVGIHLIIATQRPSVNVITGIIKANFPGRVAFRVSAKVDSRTILDTGGADQLIGRGDMLILNGSELTRVQCAFVDTPEVERIVDFIGSQQGYPTAFDLPEYEGAEGSDNASTGSSKSLKEVDSMFIECARLVVSSGSGSTSMLQRRFNLGYNRAGRIMDQMEAAGIVGATFGGKPRELMVHTEAELEEILRNIVR